MRSDIQIKLKQQLDQQRDLFNQQHSTRLHRALSWLKAADEQVANDDLRFITLWISFSACFAVSTGADESLQDEERFKLFITKLVDQDKQKKIYESLWHQYSGPVKALIKNPYVFLPFWQAQRSNDKESWQMDFDRSSVAALNALSRQQVPELLCIVLDRLYVLRDQLMQGGATWQGKVNREQVTDGVELLACLVPIIIEIMLNADDQSWGDIAYPVAT